MQVCAAYVTFFGTTQIIVWTFIRDHYAVLQWASLSSRCAVNQAGDWDYCRMCGHECMGFHLIKVCTDNCYYLISTIWKETVLIRSFDWNVRRRETNACFVVLYKSLLSGLYGSAGLEEFLCPKLWWAPCFWTPHLCLWEIIHVCPILQAHQASQGTETMHSIEDVRWVVEHHLLWA